jgi:hypothetical protein
MVARGEWCGQSIAGKGKVVATRRGNRFPERAAPDRHPRMSSRAISGGMRIDMAMSKPCYLCRCRVGGALKHAGEVFGFPIAQGPNQITRVMSLIDATRLCHGTDDTAGVKRLLLRYDRKLLTIKDFSISGPEVRKSLRETFLGPKAAGHMPSLITWFDLIIVAGKGTTQQAKKFFDSMLRLRPTPASAP